MTNDLSWAVFQALWHKRDTVEVSPIDQLGEWLERDRSDDEIAADLKTVAHASTEHLHRDQEKPSVWLRIDVLADEVLIDILEHRPLPEPLAKRTLRQVEVITLIRGLMTADDPPSQPNPNYGPICQPTLPDDGPSLIDSGIVQLQALRTGAVRYLTAEQLAAERKTEDEPKPEQPVRTPQMSLF